MKTLLLIADLDSVHTYNYCKNLLSKTSFKITLLNLKGGKETVKKEYLSFYRSLNYDLVFIKPLKQGQWSYMKCFFFVLKSLGNFDYLHLHYVSHYLCPSIFFLSNRYKKIILTYWGSDLLRSNFIKRMMTLPLLMVANNITFITTEMLEMFESLSFPFKMQRKKCQVVDYGNLFFSSISDSQKNNVLPKNAKLALGFNPDKIAIAIGYCWRKEMQQQKALESLLNSDFHYFDKVQIVIPAVGIDDETKKQMVALLIKKNVEYYFQKEFYDESQMTLFRIATDIFIHPQTTDSLSCAMMEHLYAGGIVINGSWLKYDVLDSHDIKYLQFDSFDHLSSLVNDVVESLEKTKQLVANNQIKIDKFASWKYWESRWMSLYSN